MIVKHECSSVVEANIKLNQNADVQEPLELRSILHDANTDIDDEGDKKAEVKMMFKCENCGLYTEVIL